MQACFATNKLFVSMVLIGALVVPALSAPFDVLVRDDVVLIEQVHVLRPDGSSFQAAGPVDLLLKDGRVIELGSDLSVDLKPGQMRMRGVNRWLLPAPSARVKGEVRSSDLVVAGLSGLGALAVDMDSKASDSLQARARLDTAALPILLPADAVVEGAVPDVPGRAPTLARLAESIGGSDQLLNALSKQADDPYEPGNPVSFIMVSEDPRLNADVLLDPHAVLLGSEVILKSERSIRLEEALAGENLIPVRGDDELEALPEDDAQSWSRRYRLIVDGLERGGALLRVREAEDGSVNAEVIAHVGSPVDEQLHAVVSWSAPRSEDGARWQEGVSVVLKSQGRVMEARSIVNAQGRELEVLLDGNQREGGRIQLDPNDLLLPHTLLVLVDSALMIGDSGEGEVLELAFMNGPLEIHHSRRMALRALQPEDDLPLREAFLVRLGGPAAVLLRALPLGEEDPSVALIALDDRRRPLLLLLKTPWGYVEWSVLEEACPHNGGLPESEKVVENGHQVP